MIDSVLTKMNVSLKVKITVKTLVSIGIIALAVALPQFVHLVAGASGGMKYLPMYLPILLGGCLLGSLWGLGVGVMSPIVSYLITSIFGNPMPALARLPFMMAELTVIATISGLFSKKIASNGWVSFPAVLLSFVCGRGVFMLLSVIFASVSALNPTIVWTQIQSGFIGLILQAVIIPFIVMGLNKVMNKND